MTGNVSKSKHIVGHGLEIKGLVSSVDYLPDGANVGDIFQVGTDEQKLYLWDGESWEYIGNYRGMQGPKGEKGEKGDTGPQGEKGEPFKYIDFTPEQLESLKGDKGDKGDKGNQGIQGIQGVQGKDGYTPVKGVDYFTAADIASLGIDAKADKIDLHNLKEEIYADVYTDMDGVREDIVVARDDLERKINLKADKTRVDNIASTVLTNQRNIKNLQEDKADTSYVDEKHEDLQIIINDISNLFELQKSKNILKSDNESGYYDGTKKVSSTNHVRTPNPIPIESGHSDITITTNLEKDKRTEKDIVSIIWLDENTSQISVNSTRTGWISGAGTTRFYIPENAVSFLLWVGGVATSGATIANFSIQYDNYGSAIYEPYFEPKTVLKKSNLDYGVQPLNGKTIVNFGDSIFGNRRPPNDISTEIARLTGATVHNCGFGGCRMTSRSDNFGAFSMCALADAIANNDWTLQDAAVNATGWGMPSYFPEALTLLKSIDFSKVDIVTIAYGTNDFTGECGLENAENNKDTTKFAGALRYSIETLLGAYPHLKIFVCSQTYRFWLDENGEFSEDSDTKIFDGKTLTDFVTKTKEVAEEYHIPYIDNYNIGMNKYNRSVYFSSTDGTHPLIKGGNLIASHIAKALF